MIYGTCKSLEKTYPLSKYMYNLRENKYKSMRLRDGHLKTVMGNFYLLYVEI